jgi:hypothetical protein
VIVGGYVLHVYCDYPKCKSGEFGMRSAMDEFGGPTAIAARKETRDGHSRRTEGAIAALTVY